MSHHPPYRWQPASATESSSDCSSDDYGRPGHTPRGRIPRGRGNPPRAPTAPPSPNTPSLIDSASDTHSSLPSPRRYEYEYGFGSYPVVEPEIVDHSYPSYTGAYGYANPHGYAHHHEERYAPPPPPPAPPAKRRPAPVTIPPVGQPANCILADPDEIASPVRRGGPKAGSYLDAFASAPDPEVVTMRSSELPLVPMASPPGPTQMGAAHTAMRPGYFATPLHAHPVAPMVASEGSWGGDEYEEPGYGRDRPRNGIRHVHGSGRESRSRPLPQSRGPARGRDYEREIIEREVLREEERAARERTRRNKSRSRQHRHSSRPPREEAVGYSTELQAKLDAVRTRLEAVRLDPYAQEIMAEEGIKFDELLPKNMGGTA